MADRQQILGFQYPKLLAELQEKARVTKALHERVQAFESKQEDYAQTLLCVDRIWRQLNTDVRHMAVLAAAGAPGPEDTDDAPSTSEPLSRVADPFLEALLRSDSGAVKAVQDQLKGVQARQNQVELVLQQRASITKERLTRLLHLVQTLRASEEQLTSQLASGSTDEVLKQQCLKITAEHAALQKQLTSMGAAHRSAQEAAQFAQAREQEAKEKIKSLHREVADLEVALANANRKLSTDGQAASQQQPQQQALPNGGPPSSAPPPPPPASAAPSGRASMEPPAVKQEEGVASSAELEDAHALVALRDAELDRERERHMKTQKELQEALERVKSEAWAPQTAAFQAQRAEVQRLHAALDAKQRELEAASRERDAAQRECAEKRHLAAQEQAALKRVAAANEQVVQLQAAAADADRKRHAAEQELQAERAKVGNAKTIAELQALVASLKQEIGLLQVRTYMSARQGTLWRVRTGACQPLLHPGVPAAHACAHAGRPWMMRSIDGLGESRAWRVRGLCVPVPIVTRFALAALLLYLNWRQLPPCLSFLPRRRAPSPLSRLHTFLLAPCIPAPCTQNRLDKTKVSAEQCAAAAEATGSVHAQLAAKDAELGRLRDDLVAVVKEGEGQRRRVAELQEEVADLHAFVQVLVAFCDDPRDVAEVRASEQVLRSKLEEAERRLAGQELAQRIAALTSQQAALEAKAAAAAAAADGAAAQVAGLRKQIEELEGHLSSARATADTYLEELEVTGKAYEDAQAQSVRLAAQVAERDDAANRAAAERLKLQQAGQALEASVVAARAETQRVRAELTAMASARDGLVKQVSELSAQLEGLRGELTAAAARRESLQREMSGRDTTIATLNAQLDELKRKASEQQAALDAEVEKLSKERAKRQKAEDEKAVLRGRLDKSRREGGSGGGGGLGKSELEEENESLRKLLICSVCHVNTKDVVITRCMHCFCKPCIDKNIEMRHRKCPGCGKGFSKDDVQNFYLT